jgi:hypothetical protein
MAREGGQTKQVMWITNGFRIEIMYVYYIGMEIYVFGYTNIVPPFYCLCISILFSYHELNINTTKTIQNRKFESLHNYIFHQTLHSYKNFVSSEGVSKRHKHSLIYCAKKN